MGKEFKDTVFNESRNASEYAVEFAVDEEVAVEEEVVRTPAGRELCRKPRTREEWDEWNAEFEKSMANGDFYTGEEFIIIMKEDFKI